MSRPVEIPAGIDPRNESWYDPNRNENTKLPDTYCKGATCKDGVWYALVYDGWGAKGQRNHALWLPEGGKATETEALKVGQEHVEALLRSRGRWLDDAEAALIPTEATGRKKRATLCLDQALAEIEADAKASLKHNTAENIVRGCNTIRRFLPEERLFVPLSRLHPDEFKKEISPKIAASDDLTRNTKKKYFQDTRSVCRELREKFGLSSEFEKALKAPNDMTGADPSERRFTEYEKFVMEKNVREVTNPKVVNETLVGIHYFGTCAMLQPIDVVFRRWDELTQGFEEIMARRAKTEEPFTIHISHRFRAWLRRRQAKGGIWARGYIFPEFLYEKEDVASGKCNDKELTKEQKQKLQAKAKSRLTNCFNRFLKTFGLKKKGVSYVSYRHHNLPLLESLGISARVRMDMAGHLDPDSLLNYGGLGAAWELRRAAKLLEEDWIASGSSRRKRRVLTISEHAEHNDRARAKAVRRIVETIGRASSGVKTHLDAKTTKMLNEMGTWNTIMAARLGRPKEDLKEVRGRIECILKAMGFNAIQLQWVVMVIQMLLNGELRDSSKDQAAAKLTDDLIIDNGNRADREATLMAQVTGMGEKSASNGS